MISFYLLFCKFSIFFCLIASCCYSNNNHKNVVHAAAVEQQLQPILTELEAYETLRNNAWNVTRIHNINLAVVPNNDNNNNNSNDYLDLHPKYHYYDDWDETTRTIPFVHIAVMLRLSFFDQKNKYRLPKGKDELQNMAAALLAAQHLNAGDGSIVQEVANLQDRCDLKFTTEVFDSATDRVVAVNEVLEMVTRGEQQRIPTVMIGAGASSLSIPTALVTGLHDLPQISARSTSKQLDDKNMFPLFGRTVPSDDGTAVPAIQYLHGILNVSHLAVLHVDDPYGASYALGLKLAAAEYAPGMKVTSFDFPYELTDTIVEHTLSRVKASGYRYIYGVFFDFVHYQPIMTEAYRQGIAGYGSHHWIFGDGVSVAYFSQPFQRGSALHLASRGSTRISAVGGGPGLQIFDTFIDSMQSLNNPYDLEYIQRKHPVYPEEPDYVPLQIVEDTKHFFERSSLAQSAFFYDAVIALGLAACQEASRATAAAKDSFFDGKTLFAAFKNSSFEGATGKNIYDIDTGTRVPSSARFSILNFVEEDDTATTTTTKDSNNNSFTNKNDEIIYLTSVQTDIFIDGVWEQRQPMIFNDGSTTPPPDLPTVTVNKNYVGNGLRVCVIIMAGIVLFLSLSFGVWTFRNRNSRPVRASQPFFLHLISTGCFFMGVSIVFQLMDDKHNSQAMCDVACVATPWFFSIGWVISFSALFTKTNRIYQIITSGKAMKRVTVTVWDTTKPLLLILTMCILILSLWTTLSSPVWERNEISFDTFGRPVETIGACAYKAGIIYFFSLAVIMFVVLAYAFYAAYRARHIATEFAESDYIFLVLAAMLLVIFMGIPVIVISRGSGNTNVSLFVTSGIAFVASMVILLLIFVPKILSHLKKPKSSRQVRISGIQLEDVQTLDESSECDEESGMLLDHPKQRLEELTKQNALLMKQNALLTIKFRKISSEYEAIKGATVQEEEEEQQQQQQDDDDYDDDEKEESQHSSSA